MFCLIIMHHVHALATRAASFFAVDARFAWGAQRPSLRRRLTCVRHRIEATAARVPRRCGRDTARCA